MAAPSRARGYLAVVAGIAVATLFIAAVNELAHVRNISLAYLIIVLWLAARYGRGPAVVASVLAFFTYNFFFIPPLYVFTIADPSEWLSLLALLATSLVLGQATAAIQARRREAAESAQRALISQREAVESEREAISSEQRTAALFELAQLVVSLNDEQRLLDALAERVVRAFAPAGVAASALILPDAQGHPVTRAVVPTDSPLAKAFDLSVRERSGRALWVLERNTVVGESHLAPGTASPPAWAAYYVPLHTNQRVVGILGIAGVPAIQQLVLLPAPLPEKGGAKGPESLETPQIELFGAFCTQIALALDRLALRRESIHAEALRESDRLKNVLLGSVTHDLRTPLASIQAAAGSLLEADVTWSEAERREFLESIMQSTDRLNRLVSNLLDLSRLEAGVAVPEKKWYPISDVIATVLDRLELAGHLVGRKIVLDVPDELPLASLDHQQIEQVLMNLVENALKYSPPEAPIEIQARAVEEPPQIEVRVTDHGIGMPASELGLIFDRFYRIQHVRLPWADARPPVGTGLGLAICKAIIEAHGGQIWAESALGTGSTFTFTLPISSHASPGALPDLAIGGSEGTAEAEKAGGAT